MALVDLVEESIVKVPLQGKTKVDIITELVEILSNAGKINDKDPIIDALLQRENQGSTGLEQGIAVPHAKTTAVDNITLAIGISPEGMEFDALDGQPSRLFFCMLAPPDQPGKHVEVLSEIARLSKSPAVLKLLINASTPGEVVELLTEED